MTRIDITAVQVADDKSGPYAITTGPDRALWFTLVDSAQIGRLAAGPDGAVWAALENGSLARCTAV